MSFVLHVFLPDCIFFCCLSLVLWAASFSVSVFFFFCLPSLLVFLFCSDWSLCLSAYYSLSAFPPLFFSVFARICLSLFLCMLCLSRFNSVCCILFFFCMSLTCLSMSVCLTVFTCIIFLSVCLPASACLPFSVYACLFSCWFRLLTFISISDFFLSFFVPTSLILNLPLLCFSAFLHLAFCFQSVHPLRLLSILSPSLLCLSFRLWRLCCLNVFAARLRSRKLWGG